MKTVSSMFQTASQQDNERKVAINWRSTPMLKRGLFSFKTQFSQVCGDSVYGRGQGKELQAYKNIIGFMEKSADMDVYQAVPTHQIVKTPPTEQECIEKLRGLKERARVYYKDVDQTDVTDNWAKLAGVRPGQPLDKNVPAQKRVLEKGARGGKRFSGTPMTEDEIVKDTVANCSGMLAEGFVIAFLNSGLRCPECQAVGKIGWCDGISHKSVDAFRDAVCTSCLENGVITLFEIKTRWEKHVVGTNGTYAGSFVALNTLMAMNANVYLVIASRDTGNVRIGKITSARMDTNPNWLYALQEGFTWGGPSSYVECDKGLKICPVRMPPLVDIITDDFCARVVEAAMQE